MNSIITLLLVIILLPVLIAGLIFFFKHIKVTYWLSLLCLFFPIGYISRYFLHLPSAIKWFSFSILTVCFLIITIISVFNRGLLLSKKYQIFFLSLFLFSFLSLLYNHALILPSLFSGVGLLAYIFLLIILNNKVYHVSSEKLIAFIIRMGVIMACVAFFQRIVLVSILHLGSSDMVTGLFSSDGQYTFYQLFCVIVVLTYWFYDRKILTRISNLQLFLLFIASIAISGNVASLIFLPLIFLFMFFFIEKRRFLAKFKIVFFSFFLITACVLVFASLWNADYSRGGNAKNLISLLTSPDFLQQNIFGNEYDQGSEYDKGGELRRGAALVFSHSLLSHSRADLLFGKGPGVTSETQLPGAEGIINQKYEGLKIGRSSYSQVLTELGYGGVTLLLIFILILFFWKSAPTAPREFALIRKITALFLLLFFAYENLFNDLGFALIVSSLTLSDS